MEKWDLHIHTSEYSSDARKPAIDQIQLAINAGLDGVVLTDHDYCRTHDEMIFLQKHFENQIRVLSGSEVMFGSVHLLVFGGPIGPVGHFSSPMELSRYIRSIDGCTIVAHPFFKTRKLNSHTLLMSGASALEVYNARRRSWEMDSIYIARQLDLGEVAGSDDHGDHGSVIGLTATLCPEPIYEIQDLVRQILMRQTRVWRKP